MWPAPSRSTVFRTARGSAALTAFGAGTLTGAWTTTAPSSMWVSFVDLDRALGDRLQRVDEGEA
jgi:hypothetical protein